MTDTAMPAGSRISERDFTTTILHLARLCGFVDYHTWLSLHSRAGWPDLTLIHETEPFRVHFWEVKTETGRVTAEQEHWLRMLGILAGLLPAGTATARVVRPRDWEWIRATLLEPRAASSRESA